MCHKSAFLSILIAVQLLPALVPAEIFQGNYYSGDGDTEYIELLNTARRFFAPDPELQHIGMLYTPAWNGFVEGPTWGAWWIQNSYGPSYAAMPFYTEPYTTFLQNAQDLWFDQMGNNERAGRNGYVAPDGSLCDAAAPGWIVYRQGDGKHAMHDWGMEFTAAGLLLQAELLLIQHDAVALNHYLPKLERCVSFIETRRDPENDLFLAGAAGNLLAPSFAGWKQEDGTYKKAYLTGLSITYIAALDRMIELEIQAGKDAQAALYLKHRKSAQRGLKALTTGEGYFIKSLDPDGARHGVYGAEQYGYFEASPNHDAMAFRVADDAQAQQIYDKIASIPLLRRHDFIIANEPGLDDMYDPGTSWLWKHGTWVNGGHWSTCEARMMLGYYRVNAYDDARRSMEQLMTFAREFRLDNPLVEFGSKVYQPKEPINLCYDSFGPPAAFVRGLFEYLYKAEDLVLVPHIPPAITRLEQKFPIRFGKKRLYLSTDGAGTVAKVWLNGKPWQNYDKKTITLAYATLPDVAHVHIALGEGSYRAMAIPEAAMRFPEDWSADGFLTSGQSRKLIVFYQQGVEAGLACDYPVEHAKLILKTVDAAKERKRCLAAGDLAPLPEVSALAADQSYKDTIAKLYQGLEAYMKNGDSQEFDVLRALWRNSGE